MNLSKKSLLVGFMFLGINANAAMDKGAVIVLDTYQYKDNQKNGMLKGGFSVKKDKFDQYSFDTPFMVTTQHYVQYENLEDGINKNIKSINSFLDCKEQRYAIQSEGDIENFPKKGSVPLSAWKTMSKSSMLYKAVCTQTKGYNQDYVPLKNHMTGWKFTEINSNYVYVNLSDLKKAKSDKPFIIRSKWFDQTAVKTTGNDQKSSVVSEISIDCKNNRYALMKSTNYSNDFEYQPNSKAKVINTTVNDGKWYELGSDIKQNLGICK